MMGALAYIDGDKGKHYSTPFSYQMQQRTSFSGWFSTDNTLYLTKHLDWSATKSQMLIFIIIIFIIHTGAAQHGAVV